MRQSTRLVLTTALVLATAGGASAQTLTVNKIQQTLGGQTLDSTNASLGIPMMYVVTISSSDGTKNPNVTVTDTLPTGGFVLLTAGCTAQGAATCPGGTSSASIPFTGNPATLTVSGLNVPAGSASKVVLTMTGYFTTTGQFTNHAQALRSGETSPEPTASVDRPLTINSSSLPIDLEVDKTVLPTTGTTGTTVGTGTSYQYTVTVKNNSSSDVYLGGFKLTDLLQYVSGFFTVDFQLSTFACSDPACPSVAPGTFTGSVSSSPGTLAFSLPWSTSSVLHGNSSFALTFNGTFYGVTCGTGSTVIRNDAFISLASSQTSIADTNPANNTGMATLTSSFSLPACTPPPSLSLSKVQVSPPNPVAWGAGVTYQISFTNNTGAALTNLNVFDFLAPSSSLPGFQATIATAPTCSPACTFGATTFPAVIPIAGATTLFVANFAAIPDTQAVTITFTVVYASPPCATSQGTTITNEAETSPVNGFAFVNTVMDPLTDCGLTVHKSLTTANPVVLGQPVEFQITYTNPFAQAVTVQTLEDVLSFTPATSSTYGDLPIQITASSCQATGSVTPLPTPISGNATVTHNNPPWSGLALLDKEPVTFGPGASLTCTIRFVPQQPTGCEGAGNPQLFNSAFIDTGVFNTNSSLPPPVFASATADLPLCRTISVQKSTPVGQQSFTPGQSITYTVRVTNNNPNDAVAGVVITDPLPPGFTYVSSTCAACSPAPTVAGGVFHATIPTIAANGFVDITIVVTAPTTGGSYDNTVTTAFNQQGNFFAGPGTVLSSKANVQVLTPRLTKAFSQVSSGSIQATLTFTLTNVPGNPLEQNITFTDTLNPGIQIVGPGATTCIVGMVSVAGSAITFHGAMQAGEATCTVTVPVAGAGCNDPTNFSNTNNIDPSNASAKLNVTQCPAVGTFDPQIPTLSPGGLIAMALLLAGMGLVGVWKRSHDRHGIAAGRRAGSRR